MKWKFVIASYFILVQTINWTETAAQAVQKMDKFNCSQPPKFGNFDISKCCRLPEINMGDAIEKCHKHIKSFRSHDSKYPAFAHVCYPECVYRETNALNSDGDIHIENVEKFLTAHVKQSDKIIVPTIVESFQTCLASIKQNMQARGIKMFTKLPELGCSPYASMIYGCVNAETFLHCPTEMWQENESSCNLARSFALQCNQLPHVAMPLV